MIIVVRGAGDIATGTIHRLFSAGYNVIALETETPSAIRRQAAFSETVYDGSCAVEGIMAKKADTLSEALNMKACIPILIDKEGKYINEIKPDVLIDAMIAKKNLGTNINMAPLTIAMGPGFEAGRDCHYVIETQRGHNLGRIISKGFAEKNTGIPGNIAGYSSERVIHSPLKGIFKGAAKIGDIVNKGDIIAYIDGIPVYASITGVVRGMLRDGYNVAKDFKIIDIDPRKEELKNCFTISDKARCIAGSVLELVCKYEKSHKYIK